MKRTIFITGVSAGLGRALAITLAQRGHNVIGVARGQKALEETKRRAGASFTGVVCDVADAASVQSAVAQAPEPVTTLINNAALYPRCDTLDETPESFMQTMQVNLGGMVNAVHAVLPAMMDAGSGRILNVSTFADQHPLPASSAYATSKGAARIFTRALIADLGDRFPGIVIGDWMPGMLATQMGVSDGIAPERAAQWGGSLALWEDPSLTGALFEQDREVLPLRGLKGKVKDALLLRRRRPRVIPPL